MRWLRWLHVVALGCRGCGCCCCVPLLFLHHPSPFWRRYTALDDQVPSIPLLYRYRDLQLTVDVLTGGGVIGCAPVQGAPPVPIFFSNPDLLWANEHPAPRFGQGAFKAALEALYTHVTGLDSMPRVRVFGKPNPEPYRLAEALLVKQWQAMGGHQLGRRGKQHHEALPFSSIYAVGDNPAADVRGANAAGAPWVSVLVHTGVFRPSEGVSNCQRDPARIVVADVDAAVRAALHRQREHSWHAMR